MDTYYQFLCYYQKKKKKSHNKPLYSCFLLWAELYHPQTSYVEVLITVPQNGTVFGHRVFKEVTKLK